MLLKKHIYMLSLLFTLLFILVLAQYVSLVGSILLFGFVVSLVLYARSINQNKLVLGGLLWVSAIVLGVLVGLYKPQGFSSPLIFRVEQFYEGGLPFELRVNISIALAGYAILFCLPLNYQPKNVYIPQLLYQVIASVFLSFVVIVVAYFILNLEFHIKPLRYILLFSLVNLCVTCIAEEAFMRLLLQAQLHQFIARITAQKYIQEYLPLLLATILFVLTHYPPTLEMTFVYALAGFSYGLIYLITKNIWASVGVHFLVNLLHFSFFSYPLV